jgi:hypothetical protein
MPLTREDLLEIADHITGVHAVAKQWVPDENSKSKCESALNEMTRRDPDLTVRAWVRAVVELLDALAAGPA